MKIYVGNLSYEASDEDLRSAFASFGEVASAQVIMDRDTGRSRGFGFVEMPNDKEGQAAIDGMNGKPVKGRSVTVNQARPRSEGAPRGGGGGGQRRDSGSRW